MQDFATVTPDEYLTPLQGAQYGTEAKESCLVLQRKTGSGNGVASVAIMWHRGSRYRFAGSFG